MRTRISGRLLLGGLIIAASIIILLFNIGVLPSVWKTVILSWQMLLIALGIICLIRRHYFSAIISIAIGFVYLLTPLSTLLNFTYPMTQQLAKPLFYFIIGLLLLVSHFKIHHPQKGSFWKRHRRHNLCETYDDGRVDYNVILSGVEEIFLRPVFRGGEINSIMGGIELDLRRATLPEGNTLLKIDSICGGITLIVPEDWNIEIKTQATLGGFTDKRISNGTDPGRKLIIIASFIMGGGEIR